MFQPKILVCVLLCGVMLAAAVRADPPFPAVDAPAAASASESQPTPPLRPKPAASPADVAPAPPLLVAVQPADLPPAGLCPVIADLLADICSQSPQDSFCSP